MAGIVKKDWFTKTELGLTTTPGGASYIGIYDTGSYFTNTDVEGALQEVGLALGTTIPATYLKLDCSNDPLTAEFDILFPDTAPGDVVLSQMGATSDGVQGYTSAGFQFILKDLNYLFAGLGKYPMINSASDGVLGIDFILPPATLIADLTGGNPKLSFIGGAAFGTLALESNFNWDGLGHNRFFTSSDIYTSGDLTAFTSLHSATGYFTDIFSTTITLNSLMALYGDHIEMDISGASYIGNGGDAWLGYVKNNDDWLPGTLSGDIAYRSQANSLDFGNTEMAMQITGNNVDVKKELMGCRDSFRGGKQGGLSASAYATIETGGSLLYTATFGEDMSRPGSIVDIAVTLNITTVTTPGDIIIESRINNTNALTKTISSGAIASVKKGSAVQARNTVGSIFVQDDLLQIYINFNTFVGTITGIHVKVGVVYDT